MSRSEDPGASKGTRARTAAQEEKEAAILDAALDLFSAQGYDGTTIDQIAQAVGMSKPNLLYYFSSKEDLYRALIGRNLDKCIIEADAIRPDGDPLEELRAYIRRSMAISRDYPREMRLYGNEAARGGTRLGSLLENRVRVSLEARAAILRGWIDAGKLRPVDPRHLLFMIWAASHHYAYYGLEIAILVDEDRDEYFETGMETIETVLLDGLRPA